MPHPWFQAALGHLLGLVSESVLDREQVQQFSVELLVLGLDLDQLPLLSLQILLQILLLTLEGINGGVLIQDVIVMAVSPLLPLEYPFDLPLQPQCLLGSGIQLVFYLLDRTFELLVVPLLNLRSNAVDGGRLAFVGLGQLFVLLGYFFIELVFVAIGPATLELLDLGLELGVFAELLRIESFALPQDLVYFVVGGVQS